MDPQRLSAGVLSGLALVAAAIVLLAAGTARLLGVTAFLAGISIAVATTAGKAFVAPAIATAAVIAPVPTAVLLLALFLAVHAELTVAPGRQPHIAGALVLAALALVVVRVLVYDPFMEVGSGTDCGTTAPVLPIPPPTYLWLGRVGDAIIVGSAVATLVVVGRLLVIWRRRGVAVGVVGLGAALIALVGILTTIGLGGAGSILRPDRLAGRPTGQRATGSTRSVGGWRSTAQRVAARD